MFGVLTYRKYVSAPAPSARARRPWPSPGDLGSGGFALYQIMQHAYTDGVTVARWTAEDLASTPDQTQFTRVWTLCLGATSVNWASS